MCNRKTTVISVEFSSQRQKYHYKTYDCSISPGDKVVTERNGLYGIATVVAVGITSINATKFIVQKIDTSNYPEIKIKELRNKIRVHEANLILKNRNRIGSILNAMYMELRKLRGLV